MKLSSTLKMGVLALVILAAQGCGPMLHRMTGGMIGDPGEVVVNEFDFGALESNTVEVAEDHFDETHASAFEDETRVLIPTVRFLFNTRQGAAASAQGSTNRAGYNASVKVTMNLANVDDKTFQQIVDDSWGKLQKEFEAMGIKVIPQSEYANNEHWQKLVAKDKNKDGIKPVDFLGGEFVFATPTGMPAYTYPGEEGGLSVLGAFNLSDRADVLENKIGEDLGKVLVVVPTYVIDFAKCYSSGGMFSDTAAASCKPVMKLRSGTGMRFVSLEKLDGFMSAQSAAGHVKLSENIETAENFGSVQKVDSDNTEIYIPYYSYSGRSSSVYAVVAEPEQYRSVSQKVIDAGTKMMFAIVKDEIE